MRVTPQLIHWRFFEKTVPFQQVDIELRSYKRVFWVITVAFSFPLARISAGELVVKDEEQPNAVPSCFYR